MTHAQAAIKFLETLRIPEGPHAGEKLKLAPFQRAFIRGAFKPGTQTAVLTVARGNGKSGLTAGLALAELLGVLGRQPRREIVCAARTQAQARIVWEFMQGLARGLPESLQEAMHWRRAPYAEVAFDDEAGQHVCRCISATPRNALGTAPTLAIMDERGHWDDEAGDALEAALVSGLGKRGGRCIVISSSAATDAHSLSKLVDDPPVGTFVAEYRPAPNLPADDLESLLQANPGAKYGIGSSPEWLQAQAHRAIARGGQALSSFRLYNRNERTTDDRRDVLLTVDDWLRCEAEPLPSRAGPCVVGVDLGGSASMSACAPYWPQTGRLEAFAAFPTVPTLADRGARDGVKDRYVEMHRRGELVTLGHKVVPAADFLTAIVRHLEGEEVACLVSDRYRQSEFVDAMNAAGLRVPVVYRGMGWKDGGEDCERFRATVFDDLVRAAPSLLLRSAFADAVVIRDPANNAKLAKARSLGRIDAAAAAILAVAEGRRRVARTPGHAPRVVWA